MTKKKKQKDNLITINTKEGKVTSVIYPEWTELKYKTEENPDTSKTKYSISTYGWDWWPLGDYQATSMTDTNTADIKYYINWYPEADKTQCPICGKWVFGLLKDKQDNEMCIECYKEIYGSD